MEIAVIQIEMHHSASQALARDVDLRDQTERCDVERLPPCFTVPLIAGLSTALWAGIWYIGRSIAGL